MPNDTRYYDNIHFEDGVFDAELDDVKQRYIADSNGALYKRGDDELLDFNKFLIADEARSDDLNQVLAELKDEHNINAWQSDNSTAHKGLVGLAFSGGGIRSATVNLGVIQGLKKVGLLKCVDYLSTVSGGGYIGSCFSSVNTSIAKQDKHESNHQKEHAHHNLFKAEKGHAEPSIFRYLRNNANYLAPNGLIDLLRVPSMFLRGMVINFFLVLPYIMLFAVLTDFVMSAEFSPFVMLHDWLNTHGVPASSYFLGTQCMLLALLIIFLISPVLNIWVQNFGSGRGENGYWQVRNVIGRFLGTMICLIMLTAFIELQPLAIRFYDQFDLLGFTAEELTLMGGGFGTGISLFIFKLIPKLKSISAKLGVYGIGGIGVLVFWLLYLHLSNMLINNSLDSFGDGWFSYEGYIFTALGLIAFSLCTVDVNFTSVSRFYRDRLSKAYIVGFDEKDQIKHTDDLKLSELDSKFTPYHLINSTLNLKSTEEAYCSDRKGDFFLFSKRFIGSSRTGYCKTTDMEASSRNVNLATAMAISAAAAAPNMGKNTVKPLCFILAMLNIRYDYWMLNPARLVCRDKPNIAQAIKDKLTGKKAPARRVGALYFIRELLGNLSAKLPFVNLSDGGHIENLGVYELIRRECKLIIACDSEADSNYTYNGLANLLRMVQIDFGVTIEMDGLDEIRVGAQHYAIGTIYYKNNKVGKMIYLKTSLLGAASLKVEGKSSKDNILFDNNPYIAYYKQTDPTFPHQSSADQFFDETQFESYRALGYQMAMSALTKQQSGR